jgi:glycolate oxidase
VPRFRGRVLRGEREIAPYARDMSGLRVAPRCVAFPEDSADVGRLFIYAHDNGTTITPRGAGSNQSGSAVGPGVIAPMLRMNRVTVSDSGIARAEAGAIHAAVDEALRKVGRTLAFDPSSRTFCTVGGNVATKASGLRGLKYGSVDRWLDSARFVCPAFGAVDTRRSPREVAKAVESLIDEARSDGVVKEFVKRRRGLKTSSGYNLQALFDHDAPGEIVTHLLCGSIGTLGIVTSVDLRSVPIPKERALLLVFLDSLERAIETGIALRPLRPSALELIDENGLAQMRSEGIPSPPGARSMLMVEFDENVEAGLDSTREIAANEAMEVRQLEDAGSMSMAWKVRERMLLRIKAGMESATTIVPPFVEDLAVPPERLLDLTQEVLGAMRREGLEPVVYGHVGEGNLHFRVPVPTADPEGLVERLGDECVRMALSLGGTVTAEHGSGRLRMRYAEREFPRQVLELFDRIKDTFDPEGILNLEVMPSARRPQQ